MKIIRVLICTSFLIFFFSCSKSDEGEKEEKLNKTGEAFMELVMQRENWLAEWEAVKQLGTPLPNRSRHEYKYYVLPVQVDEDSYYVIFYPVEFVGDEVSEKLGAPLFTGQTCSEKELDASIDIVVGKKDWEEEPEHIVIEYN